MHRGRAFHLSDQTAEAEPLVLHAAHSLSHPVDGIQLADVLATRELADVAVQVLEHHPLAGADEAPLKHRPQRFGSVGMHAHAMLDRPVTVTAHRAIVARMVASVDRSEPLGTFRSTNHVMAVAAVARRRSFSRDRKPHPGIAFPATERRKNTVQKTRLLEIVVVRFSCAMTIGFARVSTVDQNPEYQIRALEQRGCERIFEDHYSTRAKRRPELDAALDYLRKGDQIAVWRLDRLGPPCLTSSSWSGTSTRAAASSCR